MSGKKITPILAILIVGASLFMGRDGWGQVPGAGNGGPPEQSFFEHARLVSPGTGGSQSAPQQSTKHNVEEKDPKEEEEDKEEKDKEEKDATEASKTIEENTNFKATGTYKDGTANADIFYGDDGKYLVSDGKLYYAEDGVTYNHLDGTKFKETNWDDRNTIQVPENFNPSRSPGGEGVMGGGNVPSMDNFMGGARAPSVDSMMGSFSAPGAYGYNQPGYQGALQTYLEGLSEPQRSAFFSEARNHSYYKKCPGCAYGFVAEQRNVFSGLTPQ
jgi:hypothetical protein